MLKVLLVENDVIYQEIITAILRKGGYSYEVVKDPFLAQEKAKSGDLALSIINLELLKKNLALAQFLRKERKIPIILTTETDVDRDLHFLMAYELYLTLHKPFKSQELLLVMDKVLNPNEKTWFGLENYLMEIKKLYRIEIRNTYQIRKAIEQIFSDAQSWGFNFQMKNEMDLVWQEILTNAVYHSHGYSQYKEERVPIALPEPYRVLVRYGCNENQFGISVRDFCGTLTPKKIFETLKTALEQQEMIEKSLVTGEDISGKILDRGRGIDLIRRLTGEYYFILNNQKSTEIIIIYEKNYEKDDPFSSIKILELP